MNKTLIALIVAGFASMPSHAKTSNHSEHDHEKIIPASEYAENNEPHDSHQIESHDNHSDHDKHDEETEHAHDEHDEKAEHDDHNEETEHVHDEEGHEESSSATLNATQINLANIKIESLTAKKVDYQLYAPGEILFNGYTSYKVSPRISSVVLRRHVALGEHVKKGQPLVTLFSEQLIQLQADYRTAWPEWQRVSELGRKIVGEQRFISAKSSLEASEATLLAYGLSAADLQSLKSQDPKTLGQYILRAEIDGSVLSDDFEQGQHIEAGGQLMTLADEEQLWVEAHLPADRSLSLPVGTIAEVVAGDVRVQAKVSQEAHTIDSVTRTRTVRLLINNLEHRLHPGQFAEVYFNFQTEKPVIALPESALMRSADGDWTIFVEDHPNEFMPVEIELGRALGHFREINGIALGARVVTEGAFFVASQIAKGGFDPHNH
jgi:RND family efflux transporter MFP subunit